MKVTNCLSMKPVRLGLCNKLHRVSKRQACRFAIWTWLETWLLPCAQCSMYIRVIRAASNLCSHKHSKRIHKTLPLLSQSSTRRWRPLYLSQICHLALFSPPIAVHLGTLLIRSEVHQSSVSSCDCTYL